MFIITDLDWSINLDHCHKILTKKKWRKAGVFVCFYVRGDFSNTDTFEIRFASQSDADAYLLRLFTALEDGKRVFDDFSNARTWQLTDNGFLKKC